MEEMEKFLRAESKNVKTITIDISEGWDSESQYEIIESELQKLGLWKSGLVFRGFDAKKLDVVKEHGTDLRPDEIIWGSTFEEIKNRELHENAFDYALESLNPGIIIYNKDLLQSDEMEYSYIPKSGRFYKEAILAIVLLKD